MLHFILWVLVVVTCVVGVALIVVGIAIGGPDPAEELDLRPGPALDPHPSEGQQPT